MEVRPGRALREVGVAHVSASQINQYQRCPRQWAYRYILGVVRAPDAALLTGVAFHEAAEIGMEEKVRSGADPHPSDMADAAADFVREALQTKEYEGDTSGVQAKAARLSVTWAESVAPRVDPVAVEESFSVTIGDVEVVGRLDVRTEDRVVDWKTSARKPARDDVMASPQAGLYSLVTGLPITFEYLVDLKGGVATHTLESGVAEATEAGNLAAKAVEEVSTGMALGVWPRNRVGWHCSRTRCGYFERCMSGKDDPLLNEKAMEARAAALA